MANRYFTGIQLTLEATGSLADWRYMNRGLSHWSLWPSLPEENGRDMKTASPSMDLLPGSRLPCREDSLIEDLWREVSFTDL